MRNGGEGRGRGRRVKGRVGDGQEGKWGREGAGGEVGAGG